MTTRTTELSDARRAQLRMAGRLGGLANVVNNDTGAAMARARDAYTDSFRHGHACKVCPAVELPTDLTDELRSQKADALRRSHYTRLALASKQRRARRGTPSSPVHRPDRGTLIAT